MESTLQNPQILASNDNTDHNAASASDGHYARRGTSKDDQEMSQ